MFFNSFVQLIFIKRSGLVTGVAFLAVLLLIPQQAFSQSLTSNKTKRSLFAQPVARPVIATSGSSDYDTGIDSANPREMYDSSIAESSGRFTLLRAWKKEDKEAVNVFGEKTKESIEEAKSPMKKASMREELLAKYGNPKSNPTIVPQEQAPTPLKAAHAAFEAGDEELAFQYTRQYVKYISKFQGRMKDVMGMTAKAMELEGMADGEGWTGSKEYDRFDKYVQDALEEERLATEDVRKGDELLSILPSDLRELALKPLSEPSQSEQQTDEFNREKFAVALKQKLAPAIDGVVKLTLYVDADGHKDSLVMARELRSIAASIPAQSNVSFELVSHDYIHPNKERAFLKRANLPRLKFREGIIDDSMQYALPSVVIEIPSNRKEYVIEGVRRTTYLEELMKVLSKGFAL